MGKLEVRYNISRCHPGIVYSEVRHWLGDFFCELSSLQGFQIQSWYSCVPCRATANCGRLHLAQSWHWQMLWDVFYPFLNATLQTVRPKAASLALPNTRQVGHLFAPTFSVYMIDLLWDLICSSFILRLFSQTEIFWKQSLKNHTSICCIDLKGGICEIWFEVSTAV